MPRRSFSGHRLKYHRQQRGLRREQLAHDVDRSTWTVTDYELGCARPSCDTLGRLADTLGCRIDDLFAVAEPARTPQRPVTSMVDSTVDGKA